MQGPINILPAPQLIVINAFVERTKDSCLLWCLYFGMDRRGRRDNADQASGREHVSRFRYHLSSASLMIFLSSFFQSICIIGYTLFPLVIAAMLSALHLPTIARVPVYIVLIAWSLAAGVSILGGSGVVKNRVGIAVYPLFVFYVGLGCLCFIS